MALLVDKRWKHRVQGVERCAFGAQDMPGQAKGAGNVLPMSHWFQQVERNAVFGVLAGQIAVTQIRLPESADAHPDFVRGAFILPTVMKHRVSCPHPLTSPNALACGPLALAYR